MSGRNDAALRTMLSPRTSSNLLLALALFAVACEDGSVYDEGPPTVDVDVDVDDDASPGLAPGPIGWNADDGPVEITGSNRIDDSDTNPMWPEVVAVRGVFGDCSGTLISPVHVLTAGHCGMGAKIRLTASVSTPEEPSGTYEVVQTTILDPKALSGQDLAIQLLDRAVPEYGTTGAPEFAVPPAPFLFYLGSNYPAFTVGYGRDCIGGGYGQRRGLKYDNGWWHFPGAPGVLARTNPGCSADTEGPQPGDSGGPLLDFQGRVVGVFSGWSCRQWSGSIGGPGCNGTIEWTGFTEDNLAWIESVMKQDLDDDGVPDLDDPRPALNCIESEDGECSELVPDFVITEVKLGGCTGSGGDPTFWVTIRNQGPIAAHTRVDPFVGLSYPPSMGTTSPLAKLTNLLAYGESQTLTFVYETSEPGWQWVNALVDTNDVVAELDESNNDMARRVDFPDCSFN